MSIFDDYKILPSQALRQAIASGYLTADTAFEESHIQPASLDLRLGLKAWRVAASFLPTANQSILDKVERLKMHEIDLSGGGILEKGGVYIVPLQEILNLPDFLKARANPKSSTGRLDIFVRIITDGTAAFDNIPAGFSGRLYAEISPRTFSIKVQTGDRLSQLRLLQQRPTEDLKISSPLQTIPFRVDVMGQKISALPDFPSMIGWRARKHAGLIDLQKIAFYPVLDYWEPVFANTQGGVILDPDDFYILATAETVSVPLDFAAEMMPYDTAFGEFRVHYAGFFDPGFGIDAAGGKGSKGVLEVRTHEVPFLMDGGQIVGQLVYEPMLANPDKIYGTQMGSNYQGQQLKLAKQFKTSPIQV